MNAPRMLIALRAAASEAALAMMGVRPLAVVSPGPPPAPIKIDTPEQLWHELNAQAPPPSSLSGFKATMAVARGDNARKFLDQYGDTAGRGNTPAGFVRLDAEIAGAAPLRSYMRAPSLPNAPIVLMLHGLYDSKQSGYMHATASSLAHGGAGVVIPDQRWHGELFSDAFRPTFGIREAADAIAWGRELRRRHPEHPLVLLGFSLGALYVMNTLSHDEERVFAGGIAVSPPAALADVMPYLDRAPDFAHHPLLALIRQFFHDAITIRIRSIGMTPVKQHLFSQFVAWLDGETKSLRPDGRSLIETVEPSTQLHRLRAPLLIIGSEDDTVFPPLSLQSLARAAASQPLAHVVATPRGGHIGIGAAYTQWFSALCSRFVWLAPMLS